MQIEFRPDGPHSPDYTREIASAISEGVRTLNYATQQEGGLEFPSHLYDVLGCLAAAAAGQPQALRQMSQWLHTEVAQGRAVESPHYGSHGGDTTAAYEDLAANLRQAAADADALYRHLSAAQSAISGMEYRTQEDADDE